MSAGKTYWLALDVRWLQREGVVEAREEHGHEAITVLLCLMCQAKLENDGGKFKTGYRTLAREAFLADVDEARRIVAGLVSAGLIDDAQEDVDNRRVVGRISGWQADQFKGRAAARKAEERASKAKAPSGQSVTSHAPVGREQNRTGQNTPIPPDGEIGVHDATQPTMRDSVVVGQPDLSLVEGVG